ncbi:YbjN domain-containing protein [Pleionea sp. CnH1-48]|uniref:YbjN domain-containing protein n=1 Tax=Pleionea sp. CnH1-48 TaxID=2954494 RepID=UPI00209738E3|nr:YbjN domain-containing protein [Pleionea sp. CnH1-48]MCO7224585.1 YbjN domain-containing protein [Pleionea sp. CnH1-48]
MYSNPPAYPHHVAVRNFLASHGITYKEEEGSPSSFHFEVPAEHGVLSVGIRTIPEAGEVIMYSGLPIQLEKHQLVDAREAMSWVNTGLRRSCFELDQDRGHLLCRTTLWTGDKAPEPEAMQELIRCNLDVANHYLPAFTNSLNDASDIRDTVVQIQYKAGLHLS